MKLMEGTMSLPAASGGRESIGTATIRSGLQKFLASGKNLRPELGGIAGQAIKSASASRFKSLTKASARADAFLPRLRRPRTGSAPGVCKPITDLCGRAPDLDDDSVALPVGAEEKHVVLVLGLAAKAVEVEVVEGQGHVVQVRPLVRVAISIIFIMVSMLAMMLVLAFRYLPAGPPVTGCWPQSQAATTCCCSCCSTSMVCRIRDTVVGLAPVRRATCRTPAPPARASWIRRT
jgi:hypothetical protein